MYVVRDFYNAIDRIAPFRHTEGYDNVGLLTGDMSAPVKKALLALDATSEVIAEAVDMGANLIITHHPIIYNPVHTLLSGSRAYRLVAAGISVISAHTNLDIAAGGVNDILADLLELKNVKGLCSVSCSHGTDAELFIGRMGELESAMGPRDFALFVKERLNLSGLYYCGGNREIKTVALCSGDGTDYFGEAVRAGADAYVTGESKHHILLEAREKDVTYVAAGHFGTENVVIVPLMEALAEILPGAPLYKSEACTDGISFI